MNSNKIKIEIGVLDKEKLFEDPSLAKFTEAQLAGYIISTRKGIAPKKYNCVSVTIEESAATIDDIRKSLENLGLKEVVREGVKEIA